MNTYKTKAGFSIQGTNEWKGKTPKKPTALQFRIARGLGIDITGLDSKQAYDVIAQYR